MIAIVIAQYADARTDTVWPAPPMSPNWRHRFVFPAVAWVRVHPL